MTIFILFEFLGFQPHWLEFHLDSFMETIKATVAQVKPTTTAHMEFVTTTMVDWYRHKWVGYLQAHAKPHMKGQEFEMQPEGPQGVGVYPYTDELLKEWSDSPGYQSKYAVVSKLPNSNITRLKGYFYKRKNVRLHLTFSTRVSFSV